MSVRRFSLRGIIFPLAASLMVGSASFFVGVRDHRIDSRILDEGSRATGTIVKIVPCNVHSCEAFEYTFHYTFPLPDSGQSIGRNDVQGRRWADLKVGHSVEVAFDSSDPARSFIVDRGVRPLWHLVLFSLMFAAFAFWGSGALWKWWTGDRINRE